jgi:hypothetical protein
VGDELLVDGGIISFVVRGKNDTDVQVSEPYSSGVIGSTRWHVTHMQQQKRHRRQGECSIG